MSTQVATPTIHETITVDPAKLAELTATTPTLVRQATEFTIESTSDYEFSLQICEDAIKRQNAIKEFFAPTKKLAFELHRSITKMESDMLAPYQRVERLIKDRRMNWRQEEERKRQELEAQARRVAKDEADRKALADAAALEQAGEAEAAAEVVKQAIEAPAPAVVVQSSVPKQSGSAVRKVFRYRIDADWEVQRDFCSPDPKKIKAHVDAYGLQSRINGVTVFEEDIEAVRTKGK